MAQRPVLVADIGATNARFALTAGDGALRNTQVVPTAQLADGSLLPELLAQRYDFAEVAGLCLGMAGPVVEGKGQMTNGRVGLDRAVLAAQLERPVLLLNDFQALAHGVPRFSALSQLGGTAKAGEVRAVLGPGSGLGMSLCIPDPGLPLGWRVLASEGGYADLAPGSPLEAEVLALLQARFAHVCWETVLSGPGLVRLYQALAQIWGDSAAATDPTVDAAWITKQALDAQVPLCHQTLELFFAWLGAAAGNLALTSCARGRRLYCWGYCSAAHPSSAEQPVASTF